MRQQFIQSMFNWGRRDGWALAALVAAALVMTLPLIGQLDAGLPSEGMDIYATLWQRWWLERAVVEGHDPNYTPYLYYPTGLDVTFSPRRWAAFGTWIPLTHLLGDLAGYNVNTLIGLVFGGYGAYLLALRLTGQRLPAWIAGAVFTFYPQRLIDALGQPNTGSIQWIPYALLALAATLERLEQTEPGEGLLPRRVLPLTLLAALLLAWNGYLSIKVWWLAALTAALYAAFSMIAGSLWRKRAFWMAMAVFTGATLALIAPILVPLLTSPRLSQAIETNLPESGAEVLAYAIPSPDRPPLVAPWLNNSEERKWSFGNFYLGVTTIAVVAGGAVAGALRDRRRWVWPMLAVLFWLLSLGMFPTVADHEYEDVWMPYRLVASLPPFQAIRNPHRFAHALILPWAALVGMGVAAIKDRWGRERWLARGALVGLAALILYDLNMTPIPFTQMRVESFYTDLAATPGQEALIELPISGAKRYMYLQTIHGRPIVNGTTARMPEGARLMLEENALLKAWRRFKEPVCSQDWEAEAEALRSAGFRYVILHLDSDFNPAAVDHLRRYFDRATPIYESRSLLVYDLEAIRGLLPCGDGGAHGQDGG